MSQHTIRNLPMMDDQVASPSQSLCLDVFREVWEEFYDWEQEYCTNLLRSLRVSTPTPPANNPPSPPLPRSEPRSSGKVITLDPEVIEIPPLDDFKPTPSYESCTPLDMNFALINDPVQMEFFPFADDPTFDISAFASQYTEFSWVTEFHNPDLEVIVLETARRLHNSLGLSYEDIDATRVLPLRLLSSDPARQPGLLALATQRDFPPFQQLSAKTFRDEVDRSKLSNFEAFRDRLVPSFCFNLDCVQANCGPHQGRTSFPRRTPAHLTSDELRANADPACGPACFVLGDVKVPSRWRDDDGRLLQTLLRVEPDALPCDMAIILRKPCNEVLYYRRKIISDSKVQPEPPNRSQPATSIANLRWVQDEDFFPGPPCAHQGACSPGCPCYDNQRNCKRRCTCEENCSLRSRGCRCAPQFRGRPNVFGTACRTNRCPCRAALRECDPELCINCDAKTSEPQSCLNTSIQHGLNKAVEVRESQYGFGVFLLEEAEEGDLITEYIGEEVAAPTEQSRYVLSLHRHRSYVYDLNSKVVVDSIYQGNISRFINHSPTPNVHTTIYLVNGDQRLGIFAAMSITPGTELFLDYGPNFFIDPLPSQSG